MFSLMLVWVCEKVTMCVRAWMCVCVCVSYSGVSLFDLYKYCSTVAFSSASSFQDEQRSPVVCVALFLSLLLGSFMLYA